ncbi:ATP-binding protein [Streptomyces sp. NPDC058067]|uniref:ATP-binding protein n=1 Tax=Streptomyces sp. NPDC058067 TaxID=3346324 RepID=UPI0036E16021
MTELRSWGAPPVLTERAELVVAELAANAVLHRRLPGRDFRLALAYAPSAQHLRVEVTDARGDRQPHAPAHEARTETEGIDGVEGIKGGGRGLLLVDALCDLWDCVPCPPAGKTVVAELSSPEGDGPLGRAPTLLPPASPYAVSDFDTRGAS